MREALLRWYDANRRDLPWRRTRDPYAIWVSEAMCQQTQVATVLPYYARWMERFPTVESLAAANEEDVLALWQGLGYYRRARMLLAGARQIAQDGLPQTAQGWREIQGVGRYTAGAIASIAFNEATPVVDGNVLRVFARLTGNDQIGPTRERAAWAWADDQITADRPGDWNQALMEFGATVCKPKNPNCGTCPISDDCVAYRTGRVDELPRANPRPELRNVEIPACVVHRAGQFALERIPPGDWWEGLYRFPAEARGSDRFPLAPVRFVVTRHRAVLVPEFIENGETEAEWFSADEVEALPLPAPYRRLWNQARNFRLNPHPNALCNSS